MWGVGSHLLAHLPGQHIKSESRSRVSDGFVPIPSQLPQPGYVTAKHEALNPSLTLLPLHPLDPLGTAPLPWIACLAHSQDFLGALTLAFATLILLALAPTLTLSLTLSLSPSGLNETDQASGGHQPQPHDVHGGGKCAGSGYTAGIQGTGAVVAGSALPLAVHSVGKCAGSGYTAGIQGTGAVVAGSALPLHFQRELARFCQPHAGLNACLLWTSVFLHSPTAQQHSVMSPRDAGSPCTANLCHAHPGLQQ